MPGIRHFYEITTVVRSKDRKGHFKIGNGVVDEERSGWGVWRKHFYRDMG